MIHKNVDLEVSRISYSSEPNTIYRNISLNISSGQSLLVTGNNGSGKSTLLKTIANLSNPYEGYINMRFHKSYIPRIHHGNYISYIADDFLLKQEVFVSEQLFFWSTLFHPNKSLEYHKSNILKILHYFKLDVYLNSKVKYLSLGQKKRLVLAHLLLTSKPIWILDEPTLGLDNDGTRILENMIYMHQMNKGISIISSHVNINLNSANILHM